MNYRACGLVLFAVNAATCQAATGFLKHHGELPINSQDGFQEALDAVLGCGAEVSADDLKNIEQDLLPTWRSLPKDDSGRIKWRSLRYLVQRHFMRVSNLKVRGLESANHVKESHMALADVLHHQISSSSLAPAEQSFSLQDSVDLVAALQRLMFHEETTTLEKAFTLLGFKKYGLSFNELADALETYLLHWLVGELAGHHTTRGLPVSVLRHEIPGWDDISHFVRGEIVAMDFARYRQPLNHVGKSLFAESYSFDDAHAVAGAVTRVFGEFYNADCVSMRQILFKLDPEHTGRVPLPKFYQTGFDTEWRFGESEEYLRALGALDESAAWHQKQVIISNYLQSASNCAVSTKHYQLCCPDLCEGILADIEAAVGHEEASSHEILEIVKNLSMPSSEDFDDEPVVQIDRLLRTRLDDVAASHGGTVRLHSRLFAQWLHYTFPRDCPFPHKIGTTVTSGVEEFNGYAEEEEMLGIAASSNYNGSELLVNDTSEWMSLWSDEDDLLSSLPREEGGGAGMCLVLFVFVAAVYGSVRYGSLRRLGSTGHVAPGFLKSMV